MPETYNVLILGASYGSLLGVKLAMAKHTVKLVCLPEEADLINSEGAIVKFPIRGRDGLIEICTRDLAGSVSALGPERACPEDFDLVVLAMQEPQYRHPSIRNLLDRVSESARPCMSIMNMPPLPYLKRISGLDTEACRDCYADATVWDTLNSHLMTLCSPDPQAFRPPDQPVNVLQVRLPTNFKAARFESEEHTEIAPPTGIGHHRTPATELPGEAIEVPVKLRVHDSVFVPMAKWCMCCWAGNYRCIGPDRMRSIKDCRAPGPR